MFHQVISYPYSFGPGRMWKVELIGHLKIQKRNILVNVDEFT